MRDLINILTNLSEGKVGLSPGEINKYDWRFEKFIDYIKNGKPFTTMDNQQVVLDKSEADKFIKMQHYNTFKGNLKGKIADSEDEIPLSQLVKTGDFGGAAIAVGQEETAGGKEGLFVKPTQIGIVDKNIPSFEFYEMIQNNPVLNSTEYGKVIIDLANYIVSGEAVMLPEEYMSKDKQKIVKAIVDYAGEYLGVLALLYQRSEFPRKDKFEEWLGSSIDDLVLNFPSKANTNIADSYASITNPKTSHTINISSKGTGGGAAPAISGLKIPDSVLKNPQYDTAAKFIKICKEKGTIQQAFDAIDLLYESNPKSLDKKWLPFLPFSSKSPQLPGAAKASIDAKKQKQDVKLPAKYKTLTSDVASQTASEGGKLVYAIKREVADAINNRDAIPEFKDVVLEVLEMNFIQQYTDNQNGQLTFATQWPAKLDGKITVENKSSAQDPTSGGFSFKLGRTDSSVSSEPGQAEVDGLSPESDMPDMASASQEILEPTRKPKEKGMRQKR